MSASRSPWDDSEKSLLRHVHSRIPGASLRHIWQAFDRLNFQPRTKHAIKAKLKELGLSAERGHDEAVVSTPSEEQLLIPSQQSFKVQHTWSAPELRIIIPVHPLMTAARQHVATGYASVPTTTRWAVILGQADIAGLRCAEVDKVALRTYMDYLQRQNP